MAVKRLRIFAGPNGSGKSTFINKIKKQPPAPNFKLGYYINADDIEKLLRTRHALDLYKFGLATTTLQVQSYFKKSKFAPLKLNDPTLWENFTVVNNKLILDKNIKIDSYIAADIAEFIRQNILKLKRSFSYETVMSDKKKIAFLKKAKKEGYRIYLYFFATEDPLINIRRVKVRVKQNGHDVKEDIVKKRYYKSLKNLKSAVKLSDRAYLFDSSLGAAVLISEITDGKHATLFDPENVPYWFVKYIS